jgi:tRNA threonylcarbamoyl adenosine modification protein (Sua5/YciO/YrdC/YwlC family)
MQTITRSDLTDKIIKNIRKGAVFVYGIGCDALNKKAVERIRKIKGTKHPFSVIAPSKKWIKANFNVSRHSDHLKKLPGPYTFILRMKRNCVASNVSYSESVGVRIPKHWTRTIASKLGVPIVTTSANVSGEQTIRDICEIPEKLNVDFIIDGGRLGGKPSNIFDLTDKTIKRLR